MLKMWPELLTFGLGGLGLLGGAILALWLRPERLPQVEKLPRERWSGLILGWIVLSMCVPHARPIAFDFLQSWMWPLAVGAPILGFFFLDYMLARALGGLIIFYGFYLVHLGFDANLVLAPATAVVGWLIGACGIWISGKPCALRDWLRRCAANSRYRWSWAGFLILCALLSLAGALEIVGRNL